VASVSDLSPSERSVRSVLAVSVTLAACDLERVVQKALDCGFGVDFVDERPGSTFYHWLRSIEALVAFDKSKGIEPTGT
jgi:hypothetical protein